MSEQLVQVECEHRSHINRWERYWATCLWQLSSTAPENCFCILLKSRTSFTYCLQYFTCSFTASFSSSLFETVVSEVPNRLIQMHDLDEKLCLAINSICVFVYLYSCNWETLVCCGQRRSAMCNGTTTRRESALRPGLSSSHPSIVYCARDWLELRMPI